MSDVPQNHIPDFSRARGESVDSDRTHKFDVYTLREHCTTCNGTGCVEVNRDAEGWYTFRICPECRAFDGTGRAR